MSQEEYICICYLGICSLIWKGGHVGTNRMSAVKSFLKDNFYELDTSQWYLFREIKRGFKIFWGWNPATTNPLHLADILWYCLTLGNGDHSNEPITITCIRSFLVIACLCCFRVAEFAVESWRAARSNPRTLFLRDFEFYNLQGSIINWENDFVMDTFLSLILLPTDQVFIERQLKDLSPTLCEIKIKVSKVDPLGKGFSVWLGPGIKNVLTFHEILRHWRFRFLAGEILSGSSFAFIENSRPERPLRKSFVRSQMNKIGSLFKMKTKTHSLRKGGLTSLFSARIPHLETMIQGRLSMGTLKHYISLQADKIVEIHENVCTWALKTLHKKANGERVCILKPLKIPINF